MPSVTLLTFIGSAVPIMPGHSAIAVDQTVYSFEDVFPTVASTIVKSPAFGVAGDILSKFTGSGWKTVDFQSYVRDNSYRPIIFQDLSSKISAEKIKKYVKSTSGFGGQQYGPGGVCSTHTSSAINAGLVNGRFNPEGIDTPRAVYAEVERLGLSSSTTFIWANPKQKGDGFYKRVIQMTREDYPAIYALDAFPAE